MATKFDPDAYLKTKPKFDPDQYLSERSTDTGQTDKKVSEEQEEISPIETFGRSLAGEVSFGFADEIESFLRDKPVEEIRARIAEAEKQNPTASTAGTVAGFAGSLLGGAGIAKLGAKGVQQLVKKGLSETAAKKLAGAATKAGPVATGAGAGAVSEGLSAVGESTATELSERLEKAGPAALTGAAVGGALGGAVKLGSLLKRGADKTIDFGDAKTLGLTNKIKPEERKQLVDMARKHNIISINPAETFNRAVKLREDSLADLTLVRSKLPELDVKLIDKERAVADLKSISKEMDSRTTKDAKLFIDDVIEDLSEIEGGDVAKVDAMYRRLGSHLRDKNLSAAKYKSISQAFAKMSENIDETLLQAGKDSGNPALQKLYRQVNSNFRLSNKLATAAEKEASKMAGGQGLLNMSSSDIGRLGVFGFGPAIKFGAIKAGAKAIPMAGSKLKGAAIRKRESLKDVLKTSSDSDKQQTSELLDMLRNK